MMRAVVLIMFTSFGLIDGLRLTQAANKDANEKCKLFGGKRIVMVQVNQEYIDTGMFFNWYYFARPFLKKADVNLVLDIPANDNKGLLRIKELDDDVMIMNNVGEFFSMGKLRADQKTTRLYKAPFGSKPFRDMMTARVDAMRFILEQGCPILQVDVDTAWLANPFDDIEAAKTKTLILTDDTRFNDYGHGRNASNKQKYNFCGCFMYMSPDITNKCSFFDKWKHKTHGLAGDEQKALNILLAEPECAQELDFDVLPFEYYSPGNHITAANKIIHANWVKGYAKKIEKLKNHNAWHPRTEEWLSSSTH